MFFKEVINSYVVLWRNIKVADMIVVSTLPDHLHFYCIY